MPTKKKTSTEEAAAMIGKTRPMFVPVTLGTKRRLKPISAERERVKMYAARGELFKRVLLDKRCTPELRETGRCLMIGACLYLAQALDSHQVETQMFVDIWPYANVVEPKKFQIFFDMFMQDLANHAPEIYLEYFPREKQTASKRKSKR